MNLCRENPTIKNVLTELIAQLSTYPWIHSLSSKNYEKNIRRLPPEIRESILNRDKENLNEIFSLLNIIPKVDVDILMESFKIVVFSIMNRNFFNEYYSQAVDLLIDSLVHSIL